MRIFTVLSVFVGLFPVLIIGVFLTLIPCGSVLAAFPVIVKGKVTNIENGSPVKAHKVFVVIDSIGVSDTVATDMNGFYSDTIADVPGPGIYIFVGTMDCHQVLHSQTVTSLPYPITVNFSICDSTVPVECQAEFAAFLDSSAHQPNTFRFFDMSTGAPNLWFWNFGDGTGSGQQHPVHKYEQPGTYKVCLTIISNGQGSGTCTDSICHFVTTPQYKSLGGLVYAGDLPLNNPQPMGDTGVAYLYRWNNDNLTPVDTNRFTYLGYYAFPYVLEGEYLVRIELTKGSTHFYDWFPGYYPAVLNWKDAGRIDMSANTYNAQVYLSPVPDTIAGNGIIAGTVVDGETGLVLHPLQNQQVTLLSETFEALDFTYSGVQGIFRFDELPHGDYWLKIESPGKYSRLVSVSLSTENPSAEGVVLERYNHDITGQPEINRQEKLKVIVYPNPAGSCLYISLKGNVTAARLIEISGFSGQRKGFIIHGEAVTMVDAGDLSPGIYVLMVKDKEGNLLGTGKFVKMF